MGEDQREHIELMRDVAEDFNKRFGETLVVPEGNIPTVGARVRDLKEPEKKMSTTGGTPAGHRLRRRGARARSSRSSRRAETDSGREIVRARRQARDLEPDRDPRRRARRRRRTTIERDFEGTGYGDFKTAVGEEVAAWLAPVRERYLELREDTAGDRGLPRDRRREGAARSPRASWPTCARRWASGPSDAPPSLRGVRIAQLELDLDVFAGPLRPAPLADPARGAGPARGRPGRGRRRLPGPPRGPGAAGPRVRDRVPGADRGAAGAQVAADAAGRGGRGARRARPGRGRRGADRADARSTRASAPRARTWPSGTSTASRFLLRSARLPEALRRCRWPTPRRRTTRPCSAPRSAALLRTPPPIDLAHMATPRVTVGERLTVLRELLRARHVLVRRGGQGRRPRDRLRDRVRAARALQARRGRVGAGRAVRPDHGARRRRAASEPWRA